MITTSKRPTIKDIDNYMLISQGNDNKDRIESVGVFFGCNGTFENVEYLNESWNVLKIQEMILNEYETLEIGFGSWQDFYVNFRNTWNRNFFQFRQNIENAVKEYTLYDYKRISDRTKNETVDDDIKSTTTTNGKMTYEGDNSNKFSNTPNEYLANNDGFNGLTSIEENENSSKHTQEYRGDQWSDRVKGVELKDNNEVTRTNNTFEKWLELSNKNRNIIYDFIDKFSWLFLKTINIYSY